MHKTLLSNGIDLFRTLRLKTIAKFVSILALVINLEVAKTVASFLAICQNIYSHNNFCLIVEIHNSI